MKRPGHLHCGCPGHFVNWDGTLGSTGTLTKVGYSPKDNYNLLSIYCMLVSGWHNESWNAKGLVLCHSESDSVI